MSQVQALFDALAQCRRDDRFNGPFSACQTKKLLELLFIREKVFRQTFIEDKKGELGVKGRDSNQMKDIRVPSS